MLSKIALLGFEYVELGHGIRLPLTEGIQKACAEGVVKISGLHNFCPLPVEITRAAPDCYQFSAYRPAERERATKLTFQTIEFAARLKARYVVLHLGHVPMPRITRELAALAEEGKYMSREYVKKKIAAVRMREKRAPGYYERVKTVLKPIVEHAEKHGILLGIESRQNYEEIPSEREMVRLLDEIDSPNVGYWHDFGHVQTKHNLGWLDHAEWLERIAPRLIGCHLHDCGWPDHDHQVPFSGGVDYDRLLPLLPKDCCLTWEMSPRRSKAEILESLALWKERYGS